MQFTRDELDALLKQPAPLQFKGADLNEADLRNADLQGADLGGVILNGAKYDQNTKWPDGFDPVAAGAIKGNYE